MGNLRINDKNDEETTNCKPVINDSDGNEVFRLVLEALRNSSPGGGSTTTEIHRHILDHRSVNMTYDGLTAIVRLALHKAAVLGFLRRRRKDCKYYIAAMETNQSKKKWPEHRPPTFVPAINGWGPLVTKKGKVGTMPSLVVATKSHKGRIVPQKAKAAHRWTVLPLGAKEIKPAPPPPPPTPSTPSSGCLSVTSSASVASSNQSNSCTIRRSSLSNSYLSRHACADREDMEGGKCACSISMAVMENGYKPNVVNEDGPEQFCGRKVEKLGDGCVNGVGLCRKCGQAVKHGVPKTNRKQRESKRKT